MTTRIGFHWLRAGKCRHPECVVQRGGRCRVVDYPSLVGLLLHPERGPMLFDTGHHQRFIQATESFPERLYRWVTPVDLTDLPLVEQLANLGVSAGDIGSVFVSHFHADHIAGLCDFPNAKVYAMRAEWEDMRSRSRFDAVRHGFLRKLLPLDLEQRMQFAEDSVETDTPGASSSLGPGFDLLGDGSVVGLALPGHTAGQMGLTFQTHSGQQVLLLADACWSLPALAQNHPPTWLATGIFANRRAYGQTFESLRQLHRADPDLLMLPSHCSQSWEKLHAAS